MLSLFYSNWIEFKFHGGIAVERYDSVCDSGNTFPLSKPNLTIKKDLRKDNHSIKILTRYSIEIKSKTAIIHQHLSLLQKIKADHLLKLIEEGVNCNFH